MSTAPDRIEALARQALERPPDARTAFLESACATPEVQEAVRARMEALRDEESSDDSEPNAADAAETQVADPPDDGNDAPEAVPVGAAPRRVGPWRLQRELGRGSMGTVHLAERDDGDFQQRAALKLIRHDLGDDAQNRFRAERQILAQLQHPNIAHLLDGGVTENGRPYFAMEYVDGTPLVTYCNEHGLGVEARLRLFRQVCEAVEYAHRNLIVHRDLKPSNILVTEPGRDTAAGPPTGAGPQVKLLDFGIAKALEGAEADAVRTQTSERPMTPLYAAPEQVQGDPVTTATDVYTLGVVLHELLTGALPYDVRWKSVAEVAHVIATTEPSRPSEQVPATDDGGQSFADTHGTAAGALRHVLEGDLDVIVRTALRKEPRRRYASAAALDQDLERYLRGLPVEARSPTAGYRIRRFVSRNKTAVASTVAAVAALLVGLGAAVWQAQVAAAERDRARAAQAEAEEAVTFLTTLFENATPEEAQGDTLTVYQLVDRGRRRLSTLSDQPALQARMFDVMGEVHEQLSEYERADSLLRRSITVQQSLPGTNHARLGEYLSERASVQWKMGRHARADSLVREALQHFRSGDATQSTEYAELLSLKGNIALSRQHLARADSLFRESEEHYRALPDARANESDETAERAEALASLRHNRASIHYYRGQYREATTLYRDALHRYRRLAGPNHPNVVTIHSALGLMLLNQDSLQAAATHLDTAVTRGRRVLGPRHAEMSTYYSNLADVRTAQERYAAADSLYRLALAVDKETRGPTHPYVADGWHSIGTVRMKRGRPQAALKAFENASALEKANRPSVAFADALYREGTALRALERYGAAREHFQHAQTVHAKTAEPDSALTADLNAALSSLPSTR